MDTYEKLFKYRAVAYLTAKLQPHTYEGGESIERYLSSDYDLRNQLIEHIKWFQNYYETNDFKGLARESGRIKMIENFYKPFFKINKITLCKEIKKHLYSEVEDTNIKVLFIRDSVV